MASEAATGGEDDSVIRRLGEPDCVSLLKGVSLQACGPEQEKLQSGLEGRQDNILGNDYWFSRRCLLPSRGAPLWHTDLMAL